MLRPTSLAVVAALFLLVAMAPVAMAHSELDTSIPAADAEVQGSPPELITTWTQDLDPSRSSLEVRDSTGARVAMGGELGDGPRELRLALPDLAPGTYEVRWTSFSAEDGELARRTFEFTVVASATPSPTPSSSPTPPPSVPPSAAPTSAPTPSPTAPPTPTPSAAPTEPVDSSGDVLLPILAAAVFVGVLAVWMRRRR